MLIISNTVLNAILTSILFDIVPSYDTWKDFLLPIIIAGFAAYTVYWGFVKETKRDKKKELEGDFAIISYFSLDEKYRSKGVGKQLEEYCVEQSKKRCC